jgi:hypothetical protein
LGLLAQQRYSPRVEETLVQLAAETTFGKAVRLLGRFTGVRTSGSTARRRAYAAGAAALAVEEAERARLVAALPPVQRTADCLQLSIDATKVQLVGGEWTDVKLASLARVVAGQERDGTPRAQAVELTYAARWAPAASFGQTLTLETQRRNLDGAACVVSPNDGACWIQPLVDLLAPQAVRILDEPHAAEHLGTISQAAFGAASLQATDWVARQRTALLEDPDGPAQVLADLDLRLAAGPHPQAPRTAEDPDPAAVLAREVAYFHSRADQIRYVAFRQAGYPIGSGCVESGHNVIIAPRCKRAGMRWAGAHLNPLLVLRTIEANDRWEATWPTVWQALQTSSRQQHQATQVQRRTLRLRHASAPTQEPAAGEQMPPIDAAPALTGAPRLAPAPPAPAAPPARATATAPRSRKPAPDHPWHRRFLPPKQQRAS